MERLMTLPVLQGLVSLNKQDRFEVLLADLPLGFYSTDEVFWWKNQKKVNIQNIVIGLQ
jgi:hypothetical protein